MKPLNVCLVAPLPPPYGGIAHWTGMVSRYAMGRSEVSLTVINIAPRWREIHDLSRLKRAAGGFFQMLRDIYLLSKQLCICHVDAIHLTTSGQLGVVRDIAVWALSRVARVPFVYHIRFGRVPEILEKMTLEGRLIAFVIRRAESVLAIDELTGRSIKQALPTAKVSVIPNCVDFSLLPRSENRAVTPTVLFLGWVVQTKGIVELLQAWRSINPDGWRLRVVGPGDPAFIGRLKSEYSDLAVEFLGEMDHSAAMSELASCGVFVLPSYTEGFPNAVVEAMALGRPIVSTSVGAIPEMLDQGRSGIVVKPKDAASLQLALARLISDEAYRTELGSNAERRARTMYSIDSVFDRYMKIWSFLAKAK